MPAARRFRALGVPTTKDDVETPEPLNLGVREVRSPDLIDRAEAAEDADIAEALRQIERDRP